MGDLLMRGWPLGADAGAPLVRGWEPAPRVVAAFY